MKIKNLLTLALIVLTSNIVIGQNESTKLVFNISVNEYLKASFESNGRLLINLIEVDDFKPKTSSVYNGNGVVFGRNIKNWDKNETKHYRGDEDWQKTAN
tara:strand:+ start:1311 stop:1610 length:300 start_codon:yes stop_codon:yes gene_type:complete